MAITKRVIVLEQVNTSPLMFRYAMWADVPTARQPFYAAQQVGMVSAWKDAAPADNTALQSGSVVEKIDTVSVPPGTTLVQVEAALQAQWVTWNATIQAANPWVRYGSFMDASNAWTLAGAA